MYYLKRGEYFMIFGRTAMKTYQKHWVSILLKEQKTGQTVQNPQSSIDLKVRRSRTLLKTAFEKESVLLHDESRKQNWSSTPEYKEYVLTTCFNHLDIVFNVSLKDYLHLCVLNYFSGMTVFESNGTNKQHSSKHMYNLDEITSAMAECVEFYYSQKDILAEKLSEMVSNTDKFSSCYLEDIVHIISNYWKNLDNHAYEQKIKGKLTSIALLGCSQYRYVRENSESTCELCSALDGRDFDLSEAETGVNLPPMHPNCRCSITSSPPVRELPDLPFFLEYIEPVRLLQALEYKLQKLAITMDNLADGIWVIWNQLFGEAFNDYYGTFTSIVVDGIEYQINKSTFSAVAIGPDGKFIVPENVSSADEKMLELMKERDALPIGDAKRLDLEAEIYLLYESIPLNERKVNPKNDYGFYILGSDVTDQLNSYMRQAEIDYTDMHDRFWLENFRDFISLVGNSAMMDLKNQSEWQHSACIYAGEIVDQDAMGNINYGFFGTHCNIPESVLIAGAGYAQIRAGTSDMDFWMTFFDDPRDSYRVMQGIDIYERWH